ncbi:MAG: histidine kinase [Chromatiaceae bacterium]|nr:histidine kinase [Chromatiaceae bacterium]MCP5439407.1 histidine kinase [Chromatiaceae bacterium]
MGTAQIQSTQDPQALEQAFGVFNALSQQLTTAYAQLEGRVVALTEELAGTRRERLDERAQKEHLADQLGVLLEALPAAIVLVDVRDRVDRFNPAAEQLFPGLAWGRRWSEVKQEVVAAEPTPGDWRLRDGRRVSVSQRPLNDRGRIMVVVDVTDQRRLQERAERQDRLTAMGEMAAQLAHQVRTPLSTSVLYAGQLAKGSLSDRQRQQFSEKLLDGLRHTETLVREMLAFSRGGSFSKQPIHVDDAIVTALAGLQPRLRALGARLDIDVGGARRGRIAGNLDALAGAFSNLIDNALNHGAQGVSIRITAVADDAEFLTLRVEDDGPGIDPAALPRVFDPFFTTRERGTGLGLAVVQAVVLEHGGSLRASTSTLGGARFDIQLPWIVAAQIPQSPRKQV